MVNKFKISLIAVVMFLLQISLIHAQTKQQEQQIKSNYKLSVLESMRSEYRRQEDENKAGVLAYAKQKNIATRIKLADGGVAEIKYITLDNKPVYYRTFNLAAARSTRTNYLHTNGGMGLNLMGTNMRVHVWDAGIARASHQEYRDSNGNTRYSVGDGSQSIDDHAAHVSGTVMASGVVANAKGMSPNCNVTGYNWSNDESEATTAASNGMLVSNHSYGLASTDDNGNLILPSYYAGAYISDSRSWDEILYNAPYYLMVVAAGNDGDIAITSNPLMAGYDKLTGHSTSKNNLVVANAQDAVIDANGNLTNVLINPGSSQGPTDDLRIKPDIAGNGTGVYSTLETSNTAYGTYSGTSMASPNVAGSLLLLQQHYNNLNQNFMRAATLKGLVLHTADDAGPLGPDAIWGWGLMNAKKAAEVISQRNVNTIINELVLTQGETITLQVTSNGISPLQASVSWTDVPGTATTTLNSNTARLVNDVDLRVSKDGVISTPWRLTAANANGTGDNIKDPYERIDINNASGTYTITITHKGNLSGGSQNISLIVTGIVQNVACVASIPTNLSVGTISSNNANFSWNTVPGATYQVQYRAIGSPSWTTLNTGSSTINITGLSPLTNYEAQVRSICPNNVLSAFTNSVNFTTTEVQLQYCASNGADNSDEYIARVQLNTINNVSGAATGGYSNFTNISTTLNKGTTYSITVTAGWPGTKYSEGYAAWIDYNKNGTFESTERVWSRNPTTTSPVSGSFTIPSTATNGSTRMRVSMRYDALPSACGTIDYGEVEDYTVNIANASPDTQAPTTPTNLAASNIGQTTLTLNWTASSDNIGVTGYEIYRNNSLLVTVQSNTTNITGLTANTTYNFYVKAKDAAGNSSANSNTITVTTLTNALAYCGSYGADNSEEHIGRVQLNTINNVSGAAPGGYSNFTNISTTLNKGTTYSITVTAAWPGRIYPEGYAAWIDYNQNGTFESTERVWYRNPTTSRPVSGSITIPSTAINGPTRMRVSMKYDALPSACGIIDYGEVEDYTVVIANSNGSLNDNSLRPASDISDKNDIKVFPNPVTDVLTLSNFEVGTTAILMDINGRILEKININQSESSVDMSRYNTGLYIIKSGNTTQKIIKQ